jgi:hypothetical protein
VDTISIIGYNYLQPIAALLEKMARPITGTSKEEKVFPPENGFAVSLIALGYLLMESLTNRIQYLQGISHIRGANEFARINFPNTQFPDILDELFVVRSTIVYNHGISSLIGMHLRINVISRSLSHERSAHSFER